jgi:hypothetical protein
MDERNKWIIVFLIYADFRKTAAETSRYPDPFAMSEETKIELDLLFEEIWTTPINPDLTRLFVIFDGIRYRRVQDEPMKVQEKILFYEIANPHRRPGNEFANTEVLLDVNSDMNSTDGNTSLQVDQSLAAILQRIEPSVDEKILFVTWDHGSGFGIFRQRSESTPSITVRRPVYNELDRFPYLKIFWEKAATQPAFVSMVDDLRQHCDLLLEASNQLFMTSGQHPLRRFEQQLADTAVFRSSYIDFISEKAPILRINKSDIKTDEAQPDTIREEIDTNISLVEKIPEILGNDELASAIGIWLGPHRKVDVLLMMNCSMMNLHAMYSYRDTVGCLVAPQGVIAVPGYHYQAILSYLNSHSGSTGSPQDLATYCVTSCESPGAYARAERVYTRTRIEHRGIDYWKVIAMDLQQKNADGELLLLHQINQINKIVAQLNTYCGNEDKEWTKHLFRSSRALSYEFTQMDAWMVDFINWLSAVVCANFFSRNTLNLLSGQLAKLNKMRKNFYGKSTVLASTKGLLVFEGLAVVGLEPTGYSIFFPQINLSKKTSAHQRVIDNVDKDKLLTDELTEWKTFLNAIDCGITD